MDNTNFFQCEFSARSQNEALARAVVTAFVIPLDPTVEELSDLRTAVSEAVTNSIIHGYRQDGCREEETAEKTPMIRLVCEYCRQRTVKITIEDFGRGIQDVALARQPMFTSAPELERSGLGFTIMESFMDSLEVVSEVGKGTKIVMTKSFLVPAEG